MEKAQSTAGVYMERTLALIKPDAIDKAGEIEEIIHRSGFTIIQKRKVCLSPEVCSDIYAAHYGKMFFPSLTAFMSSGASVAMVIARDQAIAYWNGLIGPANSVKARETHPVSLRALYGTDDLRNAVHGSGTFSAAEREIRIIFPDASIDPIPNSQSAISYLNKHVIPTLLSGLSELCKKKPTSPITWLADWLIANNLNKPNICEDFLDEP
ncbi:nucleoside diphosphate kinase homolog 5 [Amblyraja radiata]|uniref:nucleoside diphosphate kinase homolog 5 n=1 Tax=Amblyraja radiata TaxID=386614 RepID=UPI00140292BF|nr:nucleoside diphosphate kinase homolog 5 [Amblyraja radiata]